MLGPGVEIQYGHTVDWAVTWYDSFSRQQFKMAAIEAGLGTA